MATKEQMCDYKRPIGQSNMVDSPEDAPTWVRCPKCGRRLHPRLKDCHYEIGAEPCWHWNIPPHKVKGWWKIGKKKKTSKRTS